MIQKIAQRTNFWEKDLKHLQIKVLRTKSNIVSIWLPFNDLIKKQIKKGLKVLTRVEKIKEKCLRETNFPYINKGIFNHQN